MKIAVVAANGRVAKEVIAEALSRGHEVVAFGRHAENDTPAKEYIQKDLFDLTREDLAGFDAVVDAAGAWSPETFPIIPNAAKHLAGILAGTLVRLVVVGGAGSLFVNSEHTLTVAETPDFPDAFKGVAAAHQQALDFCARRRIRSGPTSVPPAISRPRANARANTSSRARSSRSTAATNPSSPTPTTPSPSSTRSKRAATASSASPSSAPDPPLP